MNENRTSTADGDWESTDCLLCGSSRRETIVEAEVGLPGNGGGETMAVAVVRCGECGLCYTRPRPTRHAIARFYPEDYAPHRVRRVRRPSPFGACWRRTTGRRDWERDGPPLRGGRRLLDFGCGGGAFLQRMHHRGWKVLGVDASAAVVERIRDELGLPAVASDLASPELMPESFDVVTMLQSLEHVHEPLEALRQARTLLAPGGRLYVWVPNIDGLPFVWFGPAWFGLDLPRHLVHFSPATLNRTVAAAGFRPLRLRMVRHSSWLQHSAAATRRAGRNSPAVRLLAYRPLCRIASRYCALRGRADCMVLEAGR
jgi:2-polyprenyl-3-methyl-5-hydroxy-6-metoxy-1,4-benzoquinol methylase